MNSKVRIEHTDLLFSFYWKAFLASLPFGLVMCWLLHTYVETKILLIWFSTLSFVALTQVVFASIYLKSKKKSIRDYRRWIALAIVDTFVMGCVIGYSSILSLQLPEREFFIANYLLFNALTIFSACGFKAIFLAYAVPLLVAFGISGSIYLEGYEYLSALLVVCFVLFYIISNYHEKTLLESIKVRFEKNYLLEEVEFKREEAERANRAKSTFLASASHDLRQPLQALNLYFYTLKTTLKPREQKVLGGRIENSIEILNGLFNSILDISKLDSGLIVPTLEIGQLDHVIERIIQNYEPIAREKGLTISGNLGSVAVNTDIVLLERIINNLVSNAIRYTNKGSIVLSCFTSQNSAILEVSDTGVGISDKELNNIFCEFYQVGNPERNRKKGLGLGLSIVQRLCDLLEIELKVESNEGLGTKFTLSLPGLTADVSRVEFLIEEALDDETHLVGARILIIDNEQDVADAFAVALSRWSCHARAVYSHSQAITEIRAGFLPDLIISDYRLETATNGAKIMDEINTLLPLAVPTILTTGDTCPEPLEEATSGGHTFLQKPVNAKILNKTVTTLLCNQDIPKKTIQEIQHVD